MFTLIGTSGGFVLPAIPVGAQRFSPADVAPYVAGDPGFSGSAQFPHATQPSSRAAQSSVKSFVHDRDPAFASDAALDPSLAAAMQFLNWNEKFEEQNPESTFAAEVQRREAAKHQAPTKPRKVATGAELAHELSQLTDKPKVVVFGAKSCRMCRMVQPKVERAAAKAGATLLYMHFDGASEDVYREHGISQTPTVHVYDIKGHLVSSEVYKVADVPHLAGLLEGLAA